MGPRGPAIPVVAVLKAVVNGETPESRQHVRTALESSQVARDQCCRNVAICPQCDAHCGDMDQP
jgi:hypothetical protein